MRHATAAWRRPLGPALALTLCMVFLPLQSVATGRGTAAATSRPPAAESRPGADPPPEVEPTPGQAWKGALSATLDPGRATSVTGGGLTVAVAADGGVGVLSDQAGAVLTRFPVELWWTGRPAITARTVRSSSGLVEVEGRGLGGVVSRLALRSTPRGIVVEAEAVPPVLGAVSYLSDGQRGLDLRAVTDRFVADGGSGSSRAWSVGFHGWAPLVPPPLVLQLAVARRWLGIGLVDVPAARTLGVDASGGVRVDYAGAPTALTDLGAGPGRDGLVHLPRLVLTESGSALAGLGVYHAALTALGVAPAAARPGPVWWRAPICDTWGEQVGDGALRSSALFGTQWVTWFAADCRQRLGTSDFTLVVDARWQQDLGEPAPRDTFGGIAGMRALIDLVHAQGGHVLLWWPMWVDGVYSGGPPGPDIPAGQAVDPSVRGFAGAIAARMQIALGSCSGCLDADGLKLDWEYNLPRAVRWTTGLLGLYDYLAAIHAGALAARPDALVEASSPAPQFLAVTDAVRLYDSKALQPWQTRALQVVATDPGTLVDGDGWVADAAVGPRHLLDSAVFGIAALYYVSRWGDGVPMDDSPMAGLPAVIALSGRRQGPGTVSAGPGGLWTWRGSDGSRLVEVSGRALAWLPAPGRCGGTVSGLVAALAPGTVDLPAGLQAPGAPRTIVVGDEPATAALRAPC